MSSLNPCMRIYSFLSNIKRRKIKEKSVKHKPASIVSHYLNNTDTNLSLLDTRSEFV